MTPRDQTQLPAASGRRVAFESRCAWRRSVAAAADDEAGGFGRSLLVAFVVSALVGGAGGFMLRGAPGGLVVEVVSGHETTGSTRADPRGDGAPELARLRGEVSRLEAQLALLRETGEAERPAQSAKKATADDRSQEAVLAQRLKEISARLERLERAGVGAEAGDRSRAPSSARRR